MTDISRWESGEEGLFGGTSAATPVFAGVVLLLGQTLGVNGLGNINPALYSLASEPARTCNTNAITEACAFHDITAGNNMVPCAAGTNGCSGGVMGYSATAGYDMVTGLGSVDATRLALGVSSLTSGPVILSVGTAYAGAGIAENTYIVIEGGTWCPPTHRPEG